MTGRRQVSPRVHISAGDFQGTSDGIWGMGLGLAHSLLAQKPLEKEHFLLTYTLCYS